MLHNIRDYKVHPVGRVLSLGSRRYVHYAMADWLDEVEEKYLGASRSHKDALG